MLISAAILKEPNRTSGRLLKGALILSACDIVAEAIPDIREYFYLIERRGWWGLNDSKLADIKLVEDLSLWEKTLELFPRAICLDIGPADFVDTDAFKPLGFKKRYDGIQVSRWDEFKRSDIFVRAATLLPGRTFLKLGHFSEGGTPEEIALRDRDVALAKELGARVEFPYATAAGNDGLPRGKETMNRYLNEARVGILTTRAEGINRFKMECLAAGIPMLVPSDTTHPTKKHIVPGTTGELFEPTPADLARAVEEVLARIEDYDPRGYVTQNTGKPVALKKLKNALLTACEREGHPYIFNDIDWDGRNESMRWGEKALGSIRDAIRKVTR